MTHRVHDSFITCVMGILALLTLAGCDVHELPNPPAQVGLTLRLEFDTDMGEQDFYFTRKGSRADGRAVGDHDMRYIVRAYPLDKDGNVGSYPALEMTLTKEIPYVGSDYTREESVTMPVGKYRFMVWADFVDRGTTAAKYYNATDFANIALYTAPHRANTDYRDAFSGTKDVTLTTDICVSEAETVVIDMKRPMAKYTFITSDLQEFIDKEARLMAMRGIEPETREPDTKTDTKIDTKGIDLESYRIVFYYPMYMPYIYDMHRDKAVSSATGVQYESKLTILSATEAQMGFDYVMINNLGISLSDLSNQAKVTVKVGLFDKEGNQLSMSESFDIPLTRSVNTIVRGKFLMLDAQGGVSIDPSFENDHNIPIE